MRVEPENAPGVDADALEDSVSVEQPVIEDRDRGGFWCDPLSVEVDLHRHGSLFMRTHEALSV
jgi:hypothetical protein